jgi:hypothetical protein
MKCQHHNGTSPLRNIREEIKLLLDGGQLKQIAQQFAVLGM